MKKVVRYTSGLVLLSMALQGSIKGQQSARTTGAFPVEKREKDARRKQSIKEGRSVYRERALALLLQLLDSARGLEDMRVRIRFQSRIADILWDHDQERAREVFSNLVAQIHAAVLAARSQQSAPAGQLTHEELFSTSQEILPVIFRRDSKLGEQLLNTFVEERTSGDANKGLAGSGNGSRELLLQTAMALAGSEPGRAAAIAERTLAAGLHPMLLAVIQTIRRRDPAAADGLFGKALATALQDPSRALPHLAMLAPYVLPNFDGNEAIRRFNSGFGVTQGRTADQALIVRFLQAAYQAIARTAAAAPSTADELPLSQNARAANYLIAQRLLPYFSEYLPDASVEVRSRLNDLARALPVEWQARAPDMGGLNSVQDQISAAESTQSPAQKDSLFIRASLTAAGEGDYDRALSILDRVSEARTAWKLTYRSVFKMQSALSALRKGDIESARHLAAEVSDLEQRAEVSTEIARALEKEQDIVRATEVLNDLVRVIERADRNDKQVRSLLMIARSMTSLDAPRGFEIVRLAVASLNRLTGPNTTTADQSARNSTPSATATRQAQPVFAGVNLERCFSELARFDFEGALLLSKSIEIPAVSLFAQAAVCSGVLSSPSQRVDAPAGVREY